MDYTVIDYSFEKNIEHLIPNALKFNLHVVLYDLNLLSYLPLSQHSKRCYGALHCYMYINHNRGFVSKTTAFKVAQHQFSTFHTLNKNRRQVMILDQMDVFKYF